MSKYLENTSVSRDLSAQDASWISVIYQSGKPVLDSELNLQQELRTQKREFERSGFLLNRSDMNPLRDFTFNPPRLEGGADPYPPAYVNSFAMRNLDAVVAGMSLRVADTASTDGENLIELDDASVGGGGIKRSDFVFLEVWKAQVKPALKARGYIDFLDVSAINDGDIIRIKADTYTARSSATGVAGEFEIGSNVGVAAGNFANEVTGLTGYTATAVGGRVTIIATDAGAIGNTYILNSNIDPTGVALSFAGLQGGEDGTNKPNPNSIYRYGNVGVDSSLYLTDNIADEDVGVESTQRIQAQYRIRVTGESEALNYKTNPDGFSSAQLFARGTQSAAVSDYPFVPADRVTSNLNSDASAYPHIDSGLYIAGDGSENSANALGTVDGFVYAIPIGWVYRRNDSPTGFDPYNDTNGALHWGHSGFVNPIVGTIPSRRSDRPDHKFHNIVEETDFLDCRKHVLKDLDSRVLIKQNAHLLMDGELSSWVMDAGEKNLLGNGAGDYSSEMLVCNQIGRDNTLGGQGDLNGAGPIIRNFDHISRRFSDAPVIERYVFEFTPGDRANAVDFATVQVALLEKGELPEHSPRINAGKYVNKATYGAGVESVFWYDGDQLILDLDELDCSSLSDWTGGQNKPFNQLAPNGVKITNVVGVHHNEGFSGTSLNTEAYVKNIEGIGTQRVAITLGANFERANAGGQYADGTGKAAYNLVGGEDLAGNPVDTGSDMRIFVELEIAYPQGYGLTDTPYRLLEIGAFKRGGNDEVYRGLKDASTDSKVVPFLEYDINERPSDSKGIARLSLREGFRDVMVNQVGGRIDSNGDLVRYRELVVPSFDPVTKVYTIKTSRRVFYHQDVYATDYAPIVAADADATSWYVVALDRSYGGSEREIRFTYLGFADYALSDTLYIHYYSLDPVPNAGASGYQLLFYYGSKSPQTFGAKGGSILESGGGALPPSISLSVLDYEEGLWCNTTGKGSMALPSPYPNPFDLIPIRDSLASPSFYGDWQFDADTLVSTPIGTFDLGLVKLPLVSPPVFKTGYDYSERYNQKQFLIELNDPLTDAEGRVYYDNISIIGRNRFADSLRYSLFTSAMPLTQHTPHRNVLFALVTSNENHEFIRAGELFLLVLCQWSEAIENKVQYPLDPSDDSNRVSASLYRIQGCPIIEKREVN